jgi:ribokinase
MLNPAPADGLDAATAALADVLTPNEKELAELDLLADDGSESATPAAEASARRLLAAGPPGRAVIVTLGAAGALVVPWDGPAIAIPALRVVAVDTTGAGDALNGALAAGLAAGLPLGDAARRAVAAAGLSIARAGAREGMPTAAELAALPAT